MKKQSIVALLLFLLDPLVFRLESVLMGAIDPESAAGHPNYACNYHWLTDLRNLSFFTSLAIVLALWLVVCLLVIHAKNQSARWLFLALFGPVGFAALSSLNDRVPSPTDLYAQFQRKMHWLLRAAWEIGFFVLAWMLAEQAMVFKRNLMIRHQAVVTGLSVQQLIDSQNASSGMWAFAEGNEVMYLSLSSTCCLFFGSLAAAPPSSRNPAKAESVLDFTRRPGQHSEITSNPLPSGDR